MKRENKLKYGKSLETQFWNDNVEIDENSPLAKLVDKLWNNKGDYVQTQEEKKQFENDMQEYHQQKHYIQK